eukprot:5796725-Amphidinium_carterae.1
MKPIVRKEEGRLPDDTAWIAVRAWDCPWHGSAQDHVDPTHIYFRNIQELYLIKLLSNPPFDSGLAGPGF